MTVYSVASSSIDLKPNMVGFGDLVNRSTPMLAAFQALGRVNTGVSFPVVWNVYTAAATAYDVAEGVDVSTFGYEAASQASLPVVAKYVPIRLGAVMKANALVGGTYEGKVEKQLTLAGEDCARAFEVALCGATQDVGLQAINDSTGIYAGINQGTVTAWAGSELSTISGSIHGQACSLIATMQGKGVPVSNFVAFGHPTAIKKFATSAAVSQSQVINSPPGGGPTDLGFFPHQYTWNGIKFVSVDSLPTGDIHFLDMMDASIELLAEPHVEDINGSSLDSKYAVVIMGGLRLGSRQRHCKLTGIDDVTST